MDIILLVGPQAVGKMTVGEEIEKQTGLKLLHNHMTIDLILRYMSWDEGIDLILKIREEIFERVAKYQSIDGLVITFVFSFDSEFDWEYTRKIYETFKEHNVYFVELNSDVQTRLDRNITENRLEKKWTKRNTEWSNNELVKSMDKHRMTSHEGEVPFKPYLRIDNTNIDPITCANMIIDELGIKRK